MQKTTLATCEENHRGWVIVDLDGQTLGRAATRIADLLRGRNKPIYTPHVDTGDFVVAINASKIKLTGKKWQDKKYYKHSGYIGGIKETNAEKLHKRHPEELITKAVFGMLPTNKTTQHTMKKFKVYAGNEHPHAAQQPKVVTL